MASESSIDKYVCEFVGTFMLVLTVSCCVISNGMFAAIAIACTLIVMVYTMGSISGGHFNPAVTLAVTLSNKMDGGWIQALIYVIIQLIGGCLGAAVGFVIYGHSFDFAPAHNTPAPNAYLVEFIYTFMLAFVVLNTACCDKTGVKGNQYYGLAIGSVITAGGYAAGPVSGGALNPAVSVGLEVAALGKHPFYWCLPYLVVQLLGGAVAALLFRVVRPEQFGGTAQDVMPKYVAEFLGSMILVLTVGLNVMSHNPAAAWSIAASLMCMVYALGDISGGHFNPAVTVAVFLSGREIIPPLDVLLYSVVQILGGLAAGLLYVAVYGITFPLGPQGHHSWSAVVAVEIIFTALLCFVVLNVATLKTAMPDQFFGLAIGMCITVGGYAIGGISGGSMNPAVSIGIDTVHAFVAHEHWRNCLAYAGAELIGAAVAAGCFYCVRHKTEYSGDKH